MREERRVYNEEEIESAQVLMRYLDRLTSLEDSGYTCTREIDECVFALRITLGLSVNE